MVIFTYSKHTLDSVQIEYRIGTDVFLSEKFLEGSEFQSTSQNFGNFNLYVHCYNLKTYKCTSVSSCVGLSMCMNGSHRLLELEPTKGKTRMCYFNNNVDNKP